MGAKIIVNDRMQQHYCYTLSEQPGSNFDPKFKPELTPQQMLELGVFAGKYLGDCRAEFPSEWFSNARISNNGRDPNINYFSVDASLPLAEWQAKGWIHPDDPRGWFQWYCRYFQGRRMPAEDQRQIKRWRAFSRHRGAVLKYCEPHDFSCRRKQRQALLHWAYDSRKL